MEPMGPSREGSTPGETTPRTDSDAPADDNEFCIPWLTVKKGLHGVCFAIKGDSQQLGNILEAITKDVQHIQSHGNPSEDNNSFSLRSWQARIIAADLEDAQRHWANLAIAMGFLCESGRRQFDIRRVDLDFVWDLVREALISTSMAFTVSRSAQGFLAVPLWSLMKDGNIAELFRLHVWQPDGQRGISDLAIHAHQPFAQSWILAGEGKDHTYKVSSADADTATHAEFGVSWSDSSGQTAGKAYQTHQKSSTVVNTGKLVRVVPQIRETHTRDMTYTVPAGVFHKSEVAPDVLHATLFYFDASRGFQQIAPVIGPVNGEAYTQERALVGATAAVLAGMVDSVRKWEQLFGQGVRHTQKAEWEEALGAYRSALHLCKFTDHGPEGKCYEQAVLGAIGHTYRMLGRYDLASETLEAALRDMSLNRHRVEMTGELAVVYRHMDRLQDAKRACADEYSTAQHLNLEKEMCRAVGNLGMVNFQLFLRTRDTELLDMAMVQLNERVNRARRLKQVSITELSDANSGARLMDYASQREAIALARLSLCYTEKGNIAQAIVVARLALEVTLTQSDATKTAFSRFFYGRALLLAGRHAEALSEFNPPHTCTPIIALCKEPSSEHRGYIQEMLAAGADPELRDEQGYSALDCAVYSGDTATQTVIGDALRAKYQREADQKLQRQWYEATLRKGYRELFQDKLRPVLLRGHGGALANSQQLRRVYAGRDAANRELFDYLKFVRYNDLLRCGKLPRSGDGVTQECTSSSDSAGEYIVFISYRWIAKDAGVEPAGDSPDDIHNTQYKRMIRALEQFLCLHPEVDRDALCIWIDFACIPQSTPLAGVAALPMSLAQCNAMISLLDDKYYERSWCCVEVMMVQTLRKAYGRHLWYEHVIPPLGEKEFLRDGPLDLKIDMAQKKVTNESDRPKLLFLERQTRLLG